MRCESRCAQRPRIRLGGQGEARATGDVDLLVEMQPGRNLLDLVGFKQDLEDLLGADVDVLSDGGVSPYLRERIYAEAVPL